jgi:hypothetical protein
LARQATPHKQHPETDTEALAPPWRLKNLTPCDIDVRQIVAPFGGLVSDGKSHLSVGRAEKLHMPGC